MANVQASLVRSSTIFVLVLSFGTACNDPQQVAPHGSGSGATTASGAGTSPSRPASAARPEARAPASAPAPAHSGPPKPHASVDPDVSVSTPVAPPEGAEPTLTPETAGIPAVDFGAPGPLVIRDYPGRMEDNGMVDYADLVGYSRDGKQVIACGGFLPSGTGCFVNDGRFDP